MTKKQRVFFQRVVLAAEITAQLNEHNTFGHVKLQKMVYLCELTAKMQLQDRYAKQAAGPYDRKFMHTIDAEFKRQKWFDVTHEKKDGYSKYTYSPSEDMLKYRKYYENYFSEYDEKIQWLIKKFKTAKSRQVELVATLLACWQELKNEELLITEDLLVDKFYSWSSEKEKFNREEIFKAIEWMKDNELIMC